MKSLMLALQLACASVLPAWSMAAAADDDTVIHVPQDDAEMNDAIAKARSMLPHFWQVFAERGRGESDFALKLRIEDENGVEHFWITDIKRIGGKVVGLVGNDAMTVRSVKFGDSVEVPEADISDWMYVREGKMIGNYTLRALFPQMSPAEVEEFQNVMAEP